jgi:hypothetical protein
MDKGTKNLYLTILGTGQEKKSCIHGYKKSLVVISALAGILMWSVA